jgi:hypothetical protein
MWLRRGKEWLEGRKWFIRAKEWYGETWYGRSRKLGKFKASLKARARVAALQGDPGEAHRLATEAETVSKLYNPLLGSAFFWLVLLISILTVAGTYGASRWRLGTVGVVIRGKTRCATTYLAAGGGALDLSLTGSRLDLSPLVSEQSQNLPQLGERLSPGGGGPTLASLRFTAAGGGSGRARPSQHAKLAPGSEFRVSGDRDELKVKVYGEALKGTVDVPAGARVDWEPAHGQADPQRHFNETDPDVVDFEAQIRPKLPFVVSVREPDQWDLLVDVEQKLTFDREDSTSNPTVKFSSGLESATVQFSDFEKTLSIPKGDSLLIGMAVPGKLQLRRSAGSEGIEFEFEGVVSDLRSGRLAHLEDRRPTRLHWLAESTEFKAWWGVLVLVWGLLWGIPKIKEG